MSEPLDEIDIKVNKKLHAMNLALEKKIFADINSKQDAKNAAQDLSGSEKFSLLLYRINNNKVTLAKHATTAIVITAVTLGPGGLIYLGQEALTTAALKAYKDKVILSKDEKKILEFSRKLLAADRDMILNFSFDELTKLREIHGYPKLSKEEYDKKKNSLSENYTEKNKNKFKILVDDYTRSINSQYRHKNFTEDSFRIAKLEMSRAKKIKELVDNLNDEINNFIEDNSLTDDPYIPRYKNNPEKLLAYLMTKDEFKGNEKLQNCVKTYLEIRREEHIHNKLEGDISGNHEQFKIVNKISNFFTQRAKNSSEIKLPATSTLEGDNEDKMEEIRNLEIEAFQKGGDALNDFIVKCKNTCLDIQVNSEFIDESPFTKNTNLLHNFELYNNIFKSHIYLSTDSTSIIAYFNEPKDRLEDLEKFLDTSIEVLQNSENMDENDLRQLHQNMELASKSLSPEQLPILKDKLNSFHFNRLKSFKEYLNKSTNAINPDDLNSFNSGLNKFSFSEEQKNELIEIRDQLREKYIEENKPETDKLGTAILTMQSAFVAMSDTINREIMPTVNAGIEAALDNITETARSNSPINLSGNLALQLNIDPTVMACNITYTLLEAAFDKSDAEKLTKLFNNLQEHKNKGYDEVKYWTKNNGAHVRELSQLIKKYLKKNKEELSAVMRERENIKGKIEKLRLRTKDETKELIQEVSEHYGEVYTKKLADNSLEDFHRQANIDLLNLENDNNVDDIIDKYNTIMANEAAQPEIISQRHDDTKKSKALNVYKEAKAAILNKTKTMSMHALDKTYSKEEVIEYLKVQVKYADSIFNREIELQKKIASLENQERIFTQYEAITQQLTSNIIQERYNATNQIREKENSITLNDNILNNDEYKKQLIKSLSEYLKDRSFFKAFNSRDTEIEKIKKTLESKNLIDSDDILQRLSKIQQELSQKIDLGKNGKRLLSNIEQLNRKATEPDPNEKPNITNVESLLKQNSVNSSEPPTQPPNLPPTSSQNAPTEQHKTSFSTAQLRNRFINGDSFLHLKSTSQPPPSTPSPPKKRGPSV